jgi:hypothetical protein
MGKSKKAPDYASGSYDTGGLFGSSTTSANGTNFKPTDEMSQIGNTAWSGLSNSLNNLGSTDYSNDANFQAYQNQLNKTAEQNFDTSVLSNLANRGLMRSSGLQAATNSFNNTLANQTTDLYDSYYNRQANNLANYQNTLNSLYNYITGINSGSQNNANNVSSYNLSQVQANNQANAYNNAMYANLASSIAGIATCDIRVKENIKKIGEKNGYNWYEFTYKEGLGLPGGRQEGVIAQEVEKINPNAVIEIDGIKRVDYNKLGLNKEV